MIITSIVLHNFGVYAGRQCVDLTPVKDKPVILFGGLNGGGKTTFLDAIQLCLFGPFAKCSNRASFPYEEYLKRCINKNAVEREAAIELSFVSYQDGHKSAFTLHRSWGAKNDRIKENFQVVKDGKLNQALTENWASQVEDFIPLNISSLFLFDGEKIETYANQENSAALINTAIQSLLGLDIVEQLQKDLVIFERKKRATAASPGLKENMNKEEEKIQFLQERLATARQDAASLKTHKLESLKKQLSIVEKEFSKKGGKLYQHREQVESSYREACSSLAAIKNEMITLADTALPLLLIPKLIKKTLDRARSEEGAFIESEIVRVIRDRDENLIKRLIKSGASDKALVVLRQFILEDNKKRTAHSQSPLFLNLSQSARSRLQHLTAFAFDSLHLEARELLRKNSVVVDDAEKWEIEYHSIPMNDGIKHLQEMSKNLQREISEAQQQYNVILHECERMSEEIERRRHALSRLSQQTITNDLEAKDTQRLIIHSTRARGPLWMHLRLRL
jgi:DNA sulfur modification protein DndD